jgi:hypothetical protein
MVSSTLKEHPIPANGLSNFPSQPKIPPQSEPVDSQELMRRLERVVREREELRRQKSASKRISKQPAQEFDARHRSRSPPPPTAIPTAAPTRPISFNPVLQDDLPRAVQVRRPSGNRLSSYASQPLERKVLSPLPVDGDLFGPPLVTDLHGVGQVARFGAKRDSRPSTSWNETKHTRDEIHDVDTSLDISTALQRPKSMSTIANNDSRPILITESPGMVKRHSVRQIQAVAQPVQIINPHGIRLSSSSGATSEHPALHIEGEGLAHTKAKDFSALSSPHTSSTSTIVPTAYSSSHLMAEKVPWNLATVSLRNPNRNSLHGSIINHEVPDSETPPLPHDIEPPALDFVLPDVPSEVSTPLESNSGSKRVSMFIRPQTTAFESLNFSTHRFSGISDPSSFRMSDSQAQFSLSNMSCESIPTLMPGAEKTADWTQGLPRTVPSEVRTAMFVNEQTASPILRQGLKRESLLRNEVSPPELVESGIVTNLQEEPAEDDDPIIDLSDTYSPIDDANQQAMMRAPKKSFQPLKSAPSRRRSFNPRQLFSKSSTPKTPKRNTHTGLTASASIAKTNDITVVLATGTTKSASTTRPSSRSQPILIDRYQTDDSVPPVPTPISPSPHPPFHQQLPPVPLRNRPFTTSSYSSPNLLSGVQTPPNNTFAGYWSNGASPSSAATTQLRSPVDPLTMALPPAVSKLERSLMTAECLSFLQEQEELLVRRETLRLAQAHGAHTSISPPPGLGKSPSSRLKRIKSSSGRSLSTRSPSIRSLNRFRRSPSFSKSPERPERPWDDLVESGIGIAVSHTTSIERSSGFVSPLLDRSLSPRPNANSTIPEDEEPPTVAMSESPWNIVQVDASVLDLRAQVASKSKASKSHTDAAADSLGSRVGISGMANGDSGHTRPYASLSAKQTPLQAGTISVVELQQSSEDTPGNGMDESKKARYSWWKVWKKTCG